MKNLLAKRTFDTALLIFALTVSVIAQAGPTPPTPTATPNLTPTPTATPTASPTATPSIPCRIDERCACRIDKKCSVAGSEPADQCEANMGDEVTYTYTVGPLTNSDVVVSVTDDKLGVVASNLLVPSLQTAEVTATTTIFETTTNVAWVIAVASEFCEAWASADSATVAVAAEPPCAYVWKTTQICTIGKGQSPSNNAKVSMCVTGNIVDPAALRETAHRIPVCAGSEVDVRVTDVTGIPSVSASGTLSCSSAGCSGVVQSTEKFTATSADGKDVDRMTFIPKP
jgi:hypothetical protein